jgi:PIN domain nuclease of toxin-antitoxin system
MKLLLDTHTLLWALRAPRHLPKAALQAIQAPYNEIYVSAVTSFELATKHRIGKLPGVEALLRTFDDQLRHLSARTLPISSHHALLAGGLAWEHHDPFDRLLAAQSVVEQMPLVTSDSVFTAVEGLTVLWD